MSPLGVCCFRELSVPDLTLTCVEGEDRVGLLTALTVFLLSASPDVCAVEPLRSLCLQRFTAGLEAKEPLVSAAVASSLLLHFTG